MAYQPAALNEAELRFGQGEHHTASETRIPEGYARRIVNFDLDDNGVATTRPDLNHVASRHVSSLWHDEVTGLTLAVVDDVLNEFEGDIAVPILTPEGEPVRVRTSAPMHYLALNGLVYLTNGRISKIIRADNRAHPWGVVNPVTPKRVEGAERIVYLTYEDVFGQESGAVRFDEGSVPSIDGLVPRLYWADEDSTQYRLNGTGRVLQTQGKTVMPPGRFATEFAGRVFVVRGNRLYYSEPLSYSLCDPRYNFETLESRITAIGAAGDGLYVATDHAVYFYAGTDPRTWQRRRVLTQGAIFGSGCAAPADALEQSAMPGDGAQTVFAFLTRSGVAFALNSGQVLAPTGNVLRLPTDAEVRMNLVARNGYYQLVAVPQQPAGPASNQAIDSPVEPARGES